MGAYAAACHGPFSNGTEGEEWIAKWCRYCARDHGVHDYGDGFETGPICDLLTANMSARTWPEAWIPEPDDGRFFLPSRMCCTAFTPCAPCGGDPGADDRAERVAEVTAYWRERES